MQTIKNSKDSKEPVIVNNTHVDLVPSHKYLSRKTKMNKHVEAQKSQKGKQENVPCKTEKVKYKEQDHMLILQLCSIYCIGVSYVLNKVQ